MDNLYEESKVKILRLYLYTKRVNVELSSEEEEAEMHLTSTPTVDLTGHEPHASTEVQDMDDIVHQEIDLEIIIGAVATEDVQLDDTVPWNDQPPQRLVEPQYVPLIDQPLQSPGEPQPAPSNEQPPQGFGCLVAEP